MTDSTSEDSEVHESSGCVYTDLCVTPPDLETDVFLSDCIDKAHRELYRTAATQGLPPSAFDWKMDMVTDEESGKHSISLRGYLKNDVVGTPKQSI